MDLNTLTQILTKIRDFGIINLEDINYQLEILLGDKTYTTKIDYWISGLQSISDLMIKYGMVAIDS